MSHSEEIFAKENAVQLKQQSYQENFYSWMTTQVKKLNITNFVESAKKIESIYEEIERFYSSVLEMPFLSIIILWVNSIEKDRVFGERYISMMKDLIQKNLIPYWDFKSNKPLLLKDVRNTRNETVIDSIRCYKDWSLDKREDYVTFYCEFTKWASEESFGYFAKAIDQDRQITLRRRLPYDSYIRILKELSLRERILAKIFYLGGSKLFEEIISLDIKDIDFQNNIITFSEEAISYPLHVLEDIKEYIGSRKSGYLFISRNGTKIDSSVFHRGLKAVISKLDLDPSFTFKNFFKNI